MEKIALVGKAGGPLKPLPFGTRVISPEDLLEGAVALLEVGRKVSAARRAKLEAALQSIRAILDEDNPPEDSAPNSEAAVAVAAGEVVSLVESIELIESVPLLATDQE